MLKRFVDETKLPKMECRECGLTSEPLLGSGKIVPVFAEDEKGNRHRVGEQIRAKYVCPVKHTMIEEFDI
ncbi:hypothetical protein [Bacillus cereus group sp. BfR-BA-01379]|uniref:hypothetical protein n=1 Tax=Bacillus cereus group sp. BfR-BA-01379 TaxID=2920323 RepID=UPI001F57669B|nr:hypothetical protein [Bacillus cereus group sp. BfR-BA-01379]